MEDTTPAEVLLRLLDACDESEDRAARMARSTGSPEWKAFLDASARDYRSASNELRATLNDEACAARANGSSRLITEASETEDLAASWERAECDALACFRDAFDSDLPAPLAKIVRRHYEAGIARLERLRELPAQLC